MSDQHDAGDAPARTAAEWYVALDARKRRAEETEQPIDASFAAWLTRASKHEPALERCEAAVVLARALADDPDLLFAYEETRALACRPAKRAAPPARREAHAWQRAWVGLAALAATAVIAIDATVAPPPPNPVSRAIAAAAAIVAGLPPLNGAVVLPGNYVVDARALTVLAFGIADGRAGSGGAGRAEGFAAALERELVGALRAVPGLHVIDADPVPAGAAASLAPSAIGTLMACAASS
jgi:hypothetical protein